MRFKIDRTSSSYGSEEPPCTEAVRGTISSWDRRTFATAEEYDRTLALQDGYRWAARGLDHGHYQQANGAQGIRRRFESEGWCVDIETLDELVAFSARYGSIIVEADDGFPSIEIYDDYRE